MLAAWDRRYVKESVGATLFEEVMRMLPGAVWDELAVDGRMVATPPSAVLLQLMADSASSWWDDHSTPVVEHRDDILAATLVKAFEALEGSLGAAGSERWQWGHVRTANIFHVLRLPALSALKLPVQGGPGTLNPLQRGGTHGPSWRMVVDLGPEVKAWATYPGGQSGNPLSANYRDRLPLWLKGELEPLRFPRTAADLGASQRRGAVTLTATH